MANRALLAKTKLEDFRQWLEGQGFTLLEPKGDYEVLRWQGESSMPMPIIFDNHRTTHLSCNNEAARYVQRYINQRNKNEKAI